MSGTVYYVGQVINYDESTERQYWDMQGIYTDKEKAIKSCVNKDFFIIGPFALNLGLPIKNVNPKDYGAKGWFPVLEDEPTK